MEHFSQFIARHWQLSSAFIVILLVTIINELLAQKKKAKALTAPTLVDLMNNEDVTVFDLRDKESFKQGHIIDSIHATADDFDTPKMNQYKNKKIVLVCARGLQTPAIATKLRTQGFEPLVLGGGITAWQEAQLPLVKGK